MKKRRKQAKKERNKLNGKYKNESKEKIIKIQKGKN